MPRTLTLNPNSSTFRREEILYPAEQQSREEQLAEIGDAPLPTRGDTAFHLYHDEAFGGPSSYVMLDDEVQLFRVSRQLTVKEASEIVRIFLDAYRLGHNAGTDDYKRALQALIL